MAVEPTDALPFNVAANISLRNDVAHIPSCSIVFEEPLTAWQISSYEANRKKHKCPRKNQAQLKRALNATYSYSYDLTGFPVPSPTKCLQFLPTAPDASDVCPLGSCSWKTKTLDGREIGIVKWHLMLASLHVCGAPSVHLPWTVETTLGAPLWRQ